jgi:hypothetical protein
LNDSIGSTSKVSNLINNSSDMSICDGQWREMVDLQIAAWYGGNKMPLASLVEQTTFGYVTTDSTLEINVPRGEVSDLIKSPRSRRLKLTIVVGITPVAKWWEQQCLA